MADEILALNEINFGVVFAGVIIILVGIVSIISLIEKISVIIKKPVKWLKNRDDDHNLVIQTGKELKELREKHEEDTRQSIRHDEMIREDLQRLTSLFLDKQIDDMRWEILDFTSALSSGRKYNRESFDHIFRIYNKYEKILEENKMENGLVEESIKYVREQYGILLKDGKIK